MSYILTPNAEEDYDAVIRNLAERAGSWRWSLAIEGRLLDALTIWLVTLASATSAKTCCPAG